MAVEVEVEVEGEVEIEIQVEMEGCGDGDSGQLEKKWRCRWRWSLKARGFHPDGGFGVPQCPPTVRLEQEHHRRDTPGQRLTHL